MQKFIIDTARESVEFKHYWEECVGSCHAVLGLREDWRKQLKKCRDELGFKSVRFHGLLHDDMGVYTKIGDNVVYSFFNIDSVFDFLLKIGMKPFVELSFMPAVMASGTETIFHYKANITPPKDYKDWNELIKRLVEHLIERYGIQEVRSWCFEVWNEPNLPNFWAGSQEDYFELYKNTALTIKSVNKDIPIGGPATAKNEWISEIIQYCEENNVPLDFISTHHYPTDIALGHDFSREKGKRDWNTIVARTEEKMCKGGRGALQKQTLKALEAAGHFPLYYTEWNSSPTCINPYHDDPYNAAFIAKTITDNAGLIDIYSFFGFSDIFEELYFPYTPFHGGFGLLNLHGIPKPSYRIFEFLHRMGTERLLIDSDGSTLVGALAVKDKEKLMIMVYNHQVPLLPIKEEQVSLIVTGFSTNITITLERIDGEHAYAKKYWLEMGSPEYLDKAAVSQLMAVSEVKRETVDYTVVDNEISIKISIPPHGVALLTLV